MEDRISPNNLEGKDLILLGRPAGRIWRPAKGDGFAFIADGFALNGEAFRGQGLSFFGVFRRRGSPHGSVALFLSADSTLANIIAAKVSHYGKYSYLVFQESSNRAKGTWDPDASPLTVRWPETTGRF